ncbi:MAG: beta-galactosidase [Planctomycetes bacterium]|nr:beta-galactosidase [Planctomycetota bacterium]
MGQSPRFPLQYGRHKALAGLALQNEVMPFYGMQGAQVNHPSQHGLFRAFLRRKYESIRRYNRVHLTSYAGWDEVQMRAKGLPADYLDIVEFCAGRVADQLRWRRGLVRSSAPRAAVFCHAAGGVGSVLAAPWVQEEVAALVDSWGTSMYDSSPWQHLLSAVVTRAAASGKPWGVVEMTGGAMWTHYPTTTRTPEELVSLPLMYMSLGATTNLFWQYRPERVGAESPNFGLVLENGRVPRRAQAVGRLGKALERHGGLLAGLEWPAAQTALVVDWHGFAYEVGLGSGSLHASRIEELAGILGALALGGYEVTSLSSAHWEKRGVPPGVRLLVLPDNVVMTEAMIGRLKQAAGRGISILAGPMLGHFTGYGWLRTQSELGVIEKMFGCARCDFTAAESVMLQSGMYRASGSQFFEEYALEGAEPWLHACSARGPAGVCGTRRRAGKATLWRYGSLLGRSFYAGFGKPVASGSPAAPVSTTESNLPGLLSEVAEAAGINPGHPVQPPLLIRVGRDGRKRVAFIRNPTAQEQHFLPKPGLMPVSALDGESEPPPACQALILLPQQTRVMLLRGFRNG